MVWGEYNKQDRTSISFTFKYKWKQDVLIADKKLKTLLFQQSPLAPQTKTRLSVLIYSQIDSQRGKRSAAEEEHHRSALSEQW